MIRPILSLVVLASAAAGCAGSGGYEFREALVLYRAAVRADDSDPVFIGFVNTSHPRYVDMGNVRPEIPGAKPIDDETASECLGDLEDLGFPTGWMVSSNLFAALRAHPRDHILVAEVDGKVRLLIRGAAGSDAESRRRLKQFVDSKRVIVERVGYRSGYRIIKNKEGASLFEKQRQKIAGSGGGRK
ncbi:MAG: hypothetical protein ACYTFG_15440 [Planctomycetota bacterium]